MTTNYAAMGWQAQFGTTADNVAGNATIPFVFQSEGLRRTSVIQHRDGIIGTRSRRAEDTRSGTYGVDGPVVLEPTPAELTYWLPRILGAGNGNIYSPSDVLPNFGVQVDRVTNVFSYAGCVVNKATFSASKGSPILRVSIDLAGQTESVSNAGTFPALTLNFAEPYIFTDLTLTLNGATRELDGFQLTIDNHPVLDRYMNSRTRINIPFEGRTVTLETKHGFVSANADLYGIFDPITAGNAGISGSMLFANGNTSTNFSFGELQIPPESPVVGGKAEIPLDLKMTALNAGNTAELTITHSVGS